MNLMMRNDSPKQEKSRLSIRPVELVALFFMFVGLALFQAWMDEKNFFINVGTDPYYQLIFSKFLSNPSLYHLDPIFHQSFYQTHALMAYPVFLHLLNFVTHFVSFFEALNIFQVCLSTIYLAGATFFLYKFSNRLWISALIACLSARQTPVFPTEQWGGVLTAALVIPGTFFLVFSPILFWAWLHFQNKPKQKRLVFFAQGLIGTLHPLSWYTMTCSMLFAQLIQGRFKKPAIMDTLICGVLSFLPMIPFAVSWIGSTRLSELPVEQYQKALSGIYMMFPALNIGMLPTIFLQTFAMDFGWIVLSVWALTKQWRKLPKEALLFALGCSLLFLASYAINEWILIPQKKILFIDGNRTLKFLALPMMLMITLWLADFKRTGLMLRSSLVLFLITFFNAPVFWADIQKKPFDITAQMYDQWATFNASRNPLEYVQQQSIYDASAWMKLHLKSSNSLIFVSYPLIEASFMARALGDKSIVYAWSDGSLIYHSDPKKFLSWYDLDNTLRQLHDTQGFCTPNEILIAKNLNATHILCPAWLPPNGLSLLYSNKMTTIWRL